MLFSEKVLYISLVLDHDLNMQLSIYILDFVNLAVSGECGCLDVLLR